MARKAKNKKPWSRSSKILLTIGILLLVAAGAIGGYILWGYADAQMRYNSIEEQSGIDAKAFDDVFAGIGSMLDINIDWEALRAINPDVVAWVRVEGTDINYPVVQGQDNDYYLHHSFDGSYSSSGCIFLDCDCRPDMSSGNNILYGHNMLNGSMFAQILQFKDQAFLESGKRVIIVTPERAFMLAPAFTYICDGAETLRQVDFVDENDLHRYIDELMQHAVTTSLVDIGMIDRLFSLVTCSYEANDVRTVLCCVQIDAVTYPSAV